MPKRLIKKIHYKGNDSPEESIGDKVWISNLREEGIVEENLELSAHIWYEVQN